MSLQADTLKQFPPITIPGSTPELKISGLEFYGNGNNQYPFSPQYLEIPACSPEGDPSMMTENDVLEAGYSAGEYAFLLRQGKDKYAPKCDVGPNGINDASDYLVSAFMLNGGTIKPGPAEGITLKLIITVYNDGSFNATLKPKTDKEFAVGFMNPGFTNLKFNQIQQTHEAQAGPASFVMDMSDNQGMGQITAGFNAGTNGTMNMGLVFSGNILGTNISGELDPLQAGFIDKDGYLVAVTGLDIEKIKGGERQFAFLPTIFTGEEPVSTN